MIIDAWLYVTKTGSIRLLKQDRAPNAGELQIHMQLDVPAAFFKRPVPIVRIDIPDEAIINPSAEATVHITAAAVAEALKLDVTDVVDGLRELLDPRNPT